MNIVIIILLGIVVLFIFHKVTTKVAKNMLKWETPVLLSRNIQDIATFNQIILDDMNKKISNGAIVTNEGKGIPSSFSVAGRNHIYHTTIPRYQVGEVYSTMAKNGSNKAFIVYIWIDKGWTHDAPYEIKFS